MNDPAVIAHRGASAYAPENTLEAFRRAARMGADFIETDLRFTRGGAFVLLHDARVNRTTDGHGRIARLGLDVVRRLDAGSWFGGEFAGERIPTLEEGLSLAEELHLGIYLEIKVPLDSSLLDTLAGQLRQFRLDRFVLLSFEPSMLRAIQEAEPHLKTALLARRTRLAVDAAAQAGARQLAPHYKRTTPLLVDQAHSAGLDVVTWTVNDQLEMRRMLAMGIDGIMTNRPDSLIELLQQDHFAVSALHLHGDSSEKENR